MIRKEKNLYIPERDVSIDTIQYEDGDIFLLQEIYTNWMNLNEKIRSIGGRPSFMPSEFVEALVACKMGYWRVKDSRLGFDCYDPNDKNNQARIEIKFATGRTDFSTIDLPPRYDRLNFVKFYNESANDCSFEIYDIDIQVVNGSIKSVDRPFYYRDISRYRISIMRELIERGLYRKKYSFSLF